MRKTHRLELTFRVISMRYDVLRRGLEFRQTETVPDENRLVNPILKFTHVSRPIPGLQHFHL
ncbi:hypothetical protein Hdeb2414_s0008g00263461 [Helianthus debilis subsp. tardiflorus]